MKILEMTSNSIEDYELNDQQDLGDKYNNPVIFHIPAIFDKNIVVNKNFYGLLTKYKKINTNFSAYGCPMSCTWNGGRLMHEPVYTIEELATIFLKYRELDISLQISFTNYFIEERDLYDRCGNAILELANEHPEYVEIMVSTDILENYIRNHYPALHITRSALNETDPTDEDFIKYYHLVLPKWKNHNDDFINNIPQEYRDKIEVICSEPCITDCPRKKEHYMAYCNAQMFKETGEYGNLSCDQNKEGKYYNELMILPTDIDDYIEKYNINRFKLQGREDTYHMLQDLSRYCIKKDKKEEFLINATLILKDRLEAHI